MTDCDARLEYHYAAVIKKVKDALPCSLNGCDTNSIERHIFSVYMLIVGD